MKVLFIIFMVLTAPLCSIFAIPPTKVHHTKGKEQDILAKAKQEGKLIIIDFWSEECAPCQTMEEFAFNDENLAAFMNEKCILYKVDINGFLYNESEVAAKYNVGVLPTFVVLNSMGKVIHRFEGSMSGTGFLAELRPFDTPANRARIPAIPVMNPVSERTPLNTAPQKTEKIVSNTIIESKTKNTTPPYKTAPNKEDIPSVNSNAKEAKSAIDHDTKPVRKGKLPYPSKPKVESVKQEEPKQQEEVVKVKIAEPKNTSPSGGKKAADKIRSEIQTTNSKPPFSQASEKPANVIAKPLPSVEEYKVVSSQRTDIILDNKKLADGYYEVDIKKINPTGYSFQAGSYSEFAFATKEIERIEKSLPNEKIFLNIITTKGQANPTYKVMIGSFSTPNEGDLLKTKLQEIGISAILKKCI